MIETHHLIYLSVLLVFLTGAAIVVLTGFLLACANLLAAITVWYIRHKRQQKLYTGSHKAVTGEAPMSMEEALRQAAAGKVAPAQDQPRQGSGALIPAQPGSGNRTGENSGMRGDTGCRQRLDGGATS